MSGELRRQAAVVIAGVLNRGMSLSDALPAGQKTLNAPADRALLAELSYGVLRLQPRLEWQLARLVRRPLAKREPEVHALLLGGLYQLAETRIPPHAAVAESVNAARLLGKEWAAGLVNAVLRRYQREHDALAAAADAVETAYYAHPRWLLEHFRRDWPDDWQAIATANNTRAPMTLRVNARAQSRDAYLALLGDAGIAAEAHPHAPDAVVLAEPVDVPRLPGFESGAVSVQDAAAQLAADLLDLRPGQRILDACAAPGGKTAHILERCPEPGALVAVDVDESRLDRVAQTLARLGLAATLVAADAAEPRRWWDGEPFDRILLDAPCSATGVIRRHPDIKVLRQPRDIEPLAALQARLLEALWPLLGPGGKLLYATCSVLSRENSTQMNGFIQRHPEAAALPIPAGWGRPAGFGRQILPGQDGMDGFYYACLVKRD